MRDVAKRFFYRLSVLKTYKNFQLNTVVFLINIFNYYYIINVFYYFKLLINIIRGNFYA